jgi:hypothetical protein
MHFGVHKKILSAKDKLLKQKWLGTTDLHNSSDGAMVRANNSLCLHFQGNDVKDGDGIFLRKFGIHSQEHTELEP